jgi:hypothetical protein
MPGQYNQIQFGDGLTVTQPSSGVIRVDGSGGPAGAGVPTGGTPGQILAKTTSTDYATAWVAQLDITGKVDKDSVTAAATRLVQSILVAGDTQPAFKITGDGHIQWGPGGSTAPDTNLYRALANELKTDSVLSVAAGLFVGSGSGQVAVGSLNTLVAGGPAAPGVALGPGGDTNLYRSAAGILNTDGHLRASGQIVVDMGGAGNALFFGSGFDTYMYRASAGVLEANGNLIIAGLGGSSQLVQVGANDSGGTGYRMLRVPN